MKAAVITRYGSPDVVKIREASKPAPAAGEVLIRVHATTVNRTDCGELRPRRIGRLFYGLRRPRRASCMDFAGVVEAVGAEVMSLKPGDRVFGMPVSEQWRSGRICLCAREANRLMPAKRALTKRWSARAPSMPTQG
jgi:NADPH:quinone reductase-like Zn-dependent oxidoreductase